tara:strand:+ start:635 stop:907 length:273 start_codon:yes stop_codon:yes gene_type:complete
MAYIQPEGDKTKVPSNYTVFQTKGLIKPGTQSKFEQGVKKLDVLETGNERLAHLSTLKPLANSPGEVKVLDNLVNKTKKDYPGSYNEYAN